MNFSTKNLSSKKEYSYQLGGLKGLDLYNSPLRINSSRATDMNNLIMKNNILCKRNGWKEINQIISDEGDYVELLNVWEIGGNIVIHLYIEKEIDGVIKSFNQLRATSSKIDSNLFTYYRYNAGYFTYIANVEEKNGRNKRPKSSCAFENNGVLYMLVGKYVSFKSGEGFSLVKNNAYIPTVAISSYGRFSYELINNNNPNYGYKPITKGDSVVYTQENVNLLTTKRRVKLILPDIDFVSRDSYERIYFEFPEFFKYEDCKLVIFDSYINDYVEITDLTKIKADYMDDEENDMHTESRNPYGLRINFQNANDNNLPYSQVKNQETNMLCFALGNQLTEDDDVLGEYFDILINSKDVYVEYTPISAVDNSSKIDDCSFGQIYGYQKDSSVLFLSGNENYKNMDFWSNANSKNGDFTYFPDLNYAVFGSSNYAIKGYGILSDGSMAVIKEYNPSENSIYYRTNSIGNAFDSSGREIVGVDGKTLQTVYFPITYGNIGEGCINGESVKTLNGEVVMLSKNGLYAVETNNSVSTIERFAKKRSKLIDGLLLKYDLSKACCFSFDDKYYIAFNDANYTCLVGDSKQIVVDEDNQKQYEWFKWDNIPAKKFFTLKGELYFISHENHICKFVEGQFYDETTIKLKHEDGDIIINPINKTATINEEIIKNSEIEQLNNGDKIKVENITGILNVGISLKYSDGELVHNKNGELTFYNYIEERAEILDLNNEENWIEAKNRIDELYNLDFIGYTEISMHGETVEENIKLTFTIDEENKKIYLDNKNYLGFYNLVENGVIEEDLSVDPGEDYIEMYFEHMPLCYIVKELKIKDVKAKNVRFIGKEYRELECDEILLDELYKEYDKTSSGGFDYYKKENGNIVAQLYTDEESYIPVFNNFTFDFGFNHLDVFIGGGNYFDGIEQPEIEFSLKKPVCSKFITPFIHLGDYGYLCSIKNLCVTLENIERNNLDFGYQTLKKNKMFTSKTEHGNEFDFNDLDFDYINFSNPNIAKSYSKRTNIRNVNYIRFIFENNKDYDMAINNLSLLYTVNSKLKGEK